jgi:N-acetylglucosaminyldiphosphoundecaprenol N-acetyl-beta-D-mannosaminyltransferase
MQVARLNNHEVIGVGISAMDYAGACQAIIQAASTKQPLTVTALAVHGVMTGALSREHRQRLNALDMVLPDGQPVRWALNLLFRARLSDRVYGPNLMLYVCEQAAAAGLSVGLYGSGPEVLEDLRRNLLIRFPTLRLTAVMPSRFGRVSPDEQMAVARQIEASGTDLLFVGLGCPRQEVWLYEHRTKLNMPMIAVGAAFDFHAKRLAQAPSWMQARGLEWLFRLWHEPRRLWRRYVLLNPLFVSLLALQFIGLHRTGRSDPDAVPYEGYA